LPFLPKSLAVVSCPKPCPMHIPKDLSYPSLLVALIIAEESF
jgi:hypothetical protein